MNIFYLLEHYKKLFSSFLSFGDSISLIALTFFGLGLNIIILHLYIILKMFTAHLLFICCRSVYNYIINKEVRIYIHLKRNTHTHVISAYGCKERTKTQLQKTKNWKARKNFNYCIEKQISKKFK